MAATQWLFFPHSLYFNNVADLAEHKENRMMGFEGRCILYVAYMKGDNRKQPLSIKPHPTAISDKLPLSVTHT